MKNANKILGIMAIAAIIMFSMAACKKSETSVGSVVGAITSAAATGSLPSAEMDKFLDDYDKFLDDYVKLMNDMGPLIPRIMTGDMTAAAQLEAMQSKIEEFEERHRGFAEKYNEFTPTAFSPAQMRKWEQISSRYAEAFSNMGFF